MDVPTILTLSIAAFTLFVTIIGVAVALHSTIARGLRNFDTKIDAVEARLGSRIDQIDARFDQSDARFDRLETKVDRIEHELIEFRIETKEGLARHDERLASLERHRPGLIVP